MNYCDNVTCPWLNVPESMRPCRNVPIGMRPCFNMPRSGMQPMPGTQPMPRSGMQPMPGTQPMPGSGMQPMPGTQPMPGSGMQPMPGMRPMPGTQLPYNTFPVQDPMCGLMYPQSYYKIQPIVENICAEMDTMGMRYPTQQQVESMVDKAYDTVKKTCPEFAEIESLDADKQDDANEESIKVSSPFGDIDYRFRRRGILRDLVGILLINEIFNRRRRFYY